MSYAGKYLKAHGQACSIARTPAATSYISVKRSSKSTSNFAIRESYWEGLILADAVLISGEIVQVGGTNYLVHTASLDVASGETVWFGTITNATLTHQRATETSSNGHITETWAEANADVLAFGQMVNAQMRQSDPGLLDDATYLFQAQNSMGFLVLDRLVHGTKNLKIESVDDIGLSGVVRLQCSIDFRP